ncbi:MAG: hypothetical protein OXR64_09815 [Chloroflexota bacterium]|nr:hypothetical protein [Chloroflexota bacterium]MDE2920128.1 hypothetical protein [Chloroflexota bacterium]
MTADPPVVDETPARLTFESFQEALFGQIEKELGERPPRCPMCSHDRWLGGTIEVSLEAKFWDKGVDEEPRLVTFPLIPLFCDNCRYLLLYPSKFYESLTDSDGE